MKLFFIWIPLLDLSGWKYIAVHLQNKEAHVNHDQMYRQQLGGLACKENPGADMGGGAT